MKTKLQRDWSDAEEKRGPCRVCGHSRDVDLAHVIGREHDAVITGPRGGQKLYVHKDSVVPLCGAFSENFCHEKYDRRELDLLPYLNPYEQIRAVEDAGGIERARNRICGSSV